LLYRFDAPLFFANSRFFADDLTHRIAARDDTVQCVIITAEPITDVDATAAEMLHELHSDLVANGIELRFAELKGTVHDRVDRYRSFQAEMPDHTARTTGEAVKAYLRSYDVDWVDWEDRTL
jgi:MFS superfamily sulfate permease-like transporter